MPPARVTEEERDAVQRIILEALLEGPLTVSGIAADTDLDSRAISHGLRYARNKHRVWMEEDALDKRCPFWGLTADGRLWLDGEPPVPVVVAAPVVRVDIRSALTWWLPRIRPAAAALLSAHDIDALAARLEGA